MRAEYYHSSGNDPYRNLSAERFLFESCRDQAVLYLWSNEPSVIIGKNQSALAQCRLARLREDGVHLVRRYSGGGAVYHDLGNLNFTFIAPNGIYDQERQDRIIFSALASLGIRALRTGRNDLTYAGRKFSGSAYGRGARAAYHHGTLLVSSDLDALPRYLNVSDEKLAAHGVSSVRSRVIDLNEICPALTIAELERQLLAAFAAEFPEVRELPLPDKAAAYAKELADPRWLFRKECDSDLELSGRYRWGGLTARFRLREKEIISCSVFTDALDSAAFDGLESALAGQDITDLPEAAFLAVPEAYRKDLRELLRRI